MAGLRLLTLAIALLLAAGESARWWGTERFVPLAFDELLVGIAMAAAAFLSRRLGPTVLAAAWGCYCGLVLALLIPTLDHLLHGPPKASAGLYATILSAMLALGLAALGRSLFLCREPLRDGSVGTGAEAADE